MSSFSGYYKKGISYPAYRQLVQEQYALGKATGPVQSEAMLYYTELNIARMNKWDKHLHLLEEGAQKIEKISKKQHWLVLSEGWCGDAAHALPVMHRLAELNSNIEFKILLRDENLTLMDMFLTNGGRSIPKLLLLNEAFELNTTWGPRPKAATKLFIEGKENGVEPMELKKQLQIWYSRDRGQAIQQELVDLATNFG